MGAIESWVRRVILRGSNGNEMSINTDGSLPVTIQGANSTGGALGVDVQQSEIIQPVDIQSRLATTIQTHNAVSVALSGSSLSSFIDTDGYTDIATSTMNDAGTNFSVILYWSNDGASVQGTETLLASGTGANNARAALTQTKARYVKIGIINNDAALAHTFSSWAYLKA